MKEWKCKDCCCFETDACMHPYVEECYTACSRLVVDHDEAYMQGRADAIDEVKHQMISLHTDMIFQYGADIIEARCDAFDELENWLKEQNND